MKATEDQLDHQQTKLKTLLKSPKYQHILDDGLLQDIKWRITVFHLTMQRLTTDNLDKPSPQELQSLKYFWDELETNLCAALELLNMASNTIRGLEYDEHTPGDFMSHTTLELRFNKDNDSANRDSLNPDNHQALSQMSDEALLKEILLNLRAIKETEPERYQKNKSHLFEIIKDQQE